MFARLATLVGPLVAVGLFAPSAAGGPLSWKYTATVQPGYTGATPPAAAVLALGRFAKGDADGEFATAPLPAGSAGSAQGAATIVLAESTKSDYTLGGALPADAVDGFRTLLQITDLDSGVRGFTYMNGRGTIVGGPDDRLDVQLDGGGRVWIDLGKNRYDITWRRDDTATTSRIVADVTASALVNTPEPATLLLAGLGLGVVGVRRLRK